MPHSMNVHVAHFTIRNAQELRTRLVTASTMPDGIEGNLERERVRFTFIDAAMVSRVSSNLSSFLIDLRQISSRLHLLTAVNQALLAESSDTLATHNIHSEVVWMLEPGTNVRRPFPRLCNRILKRCSFQISDSLKNFGLSKATTNLIIVRIAPMIDSLAKSMEEEESIFEAMQSLVDGETADIELLGGLPNGGTNWKALRKVNPSFPTSDES